ncbi:HNH endonuclease [Glycomyces artemisiae]|uniref:HNH endonuclease n=1 Tax=Glycomyces artemisiae TaxID=1076443 RepID=A0A2T0UWR3_9ACTN|nr:HNH endonuclease [Glycomyces artemisiae]PRY62356.1 HNH endonuclease [Glycomyces artemisiae]
MNFDKCPICLSPNPSKREHIPPESIGGTVLTRTCERCNSLVGSRLEADFADWVHDLLPTRFTHPAIQGQRRGPKIQILETHESLPVLFFEGNQCDPAIPEMLELGGEVAIQFTAPDQNRCLLAAIKSAYLTACLIFRAIPDTPEAEAIRQVLLAAIETPLNEPVPMGGLRDGLWLARIPGPGVPGEAALVHVTIEGDPEPKFAISLARKVLVDWPIGGSLVGLDAEDNVTFALPM